MNFVFYLLAALTIAGGLAAILLKNLVHCVLALTVAFAGLALLFLELDAQRAVADFRNLLLARLRELALAEPMSGVWAGRRDDELKNGLWMDDFEIPERRVDLERWGKNPLDD